MKLHDEWLRKAFNDLESAKILFRSNKNLLDICAYHSQQCAEKSLKAFLVFNNREISKTHNLSYLLSQCENYDMEFKNLIDDCIFLNPYSTQFRYPEGDENPEIEDIENAIQYAEKIYNFVSEKL